MPRKTKEQNKIENENETKKTTTQTKKTSNKKTASTKKETTKIATKKTNTKATPTKNAPKTSSSSKSKTKSTTKKVAKTTSKSTKSVKKETTSRKKVEIVEYYDLPYRYNQTIVKVLAQTPTNLFIYWDISDKDRKNFEKLYGDDFFQTTKPILIVHNDTLGYNFEVEINDFANSWYLHVSDSKCDYRIELGRRPITKNNKTNNIDYIYVTTSNEIESPNDRILFDKNQKMVYFRNVKTGNLTAKEFTSISFIRNMGKIYNIYDLYKEIYQDNNVENLYNLSNPSSMRQ